MYLVKTSFSYIFYLYLLPIQTNSRHGGCMYYEVYQVHGGLLEFWVSDSQVISATTQWKIRCINYFSANCANTDAIPSPGTRCAKLENHKLAGIMADGPSTFQHNIMYTFKETAMLNAYIQVTKFHRRGKKACFSMFYAFMSSCVYVMWYFITCQERMTSLTDSWEIIYRKNSAANLLAYVQQFGLLVGTTI